MQSGLEKYGLTDCITQGGRVQARRRKEDGIAKLKDN